MTAPTRIGLIMIVPRTRREQRTQSAEAQRTSSNYLERDRDGRAMCERMVQRRAFQGSLPCLSDRVFLGIRADVSRALDCGEARMTLLADNAEVRQDVIEPAVKGDLDPMERHTFPFGGPFKTGNQVPAERSQHVLHRARRVVRLAHARL